MRKRTIAVTLEGHRLEFTRRTFREYINENYVDDFSQQRNDKKLSPEVFEACIQYAPEFLMKYEYHLLLRYDLIRCVIGAPGAALEFLEFKLDYFAVNWCALQDPLCGLKACYLDARTIEFCISRYPEHGLERHAGRYSTEQLDYCIKNHVWSVLEHATRYLSKDQINACASSCISSRIKLNRYLRGDPDRDFVIALFKKREQLGGITRKLILSIVTKYI